jgi:NAD(P)H-dependent flavin oxidoreductase YrpB (nitropropane dioxygenase family)
MQNPVNEMLGIDFPLLAFSHCRDVVAAVTNAGGFGVLGASSFTAEQLDTELAWIDEHTGGRPYGADILFPGKVEGKGEHLSVADLAGRVPRAHQAYVTSLLAAHDVAYEPRTGGSGIALGYPDANEELMEVAFAHPIRLIANALGTPPPALIDRARAAGVPVAALVGARHHALRQAQAGVDLLIAQGSEAGGHTGSISTLVLIPEVIAAVAPIRRIPVLAAGGIVTGRQMAAAMALGADGAWTGSVWLTTEEAETAPVTKDKMVAATSGDTVRSRSRTGKPSRQLRSAWTEAWDGPDSPDPLPMPLQTMLTEPALHRVDQAAAGGHRGAAELATYFVGQGVGLMDAIRPAARVVAEFMEDFGDAAGRLAGFLDD